MELTSKNLSFNNLGSVLKVGVLPIGILAVVAMMVLPIPDAKLWRWMLPQEKQKEEHFRRKDYHGL